MWRPALLLLLLLATASLPWDGTRALDGDHAPRAMNPGPTHGTPAVRPITQTAIGQSVQGHSIDATTIGKGSITVVLVGGIHAGDEAQTVMLVQSLLSYYALPGVSLPPDTQLIFVPNLNPDGYLGNTRTNANGVDLDRNWPTPDWQPGAGLDGGSAPLSEPETRALHNLLVATGADLVVTWHAHGGRVEWNDVGPAADLGARFAEVAGYEYVEERDEGLVTGELIEAAAALGIPALDVEIAGPPDDPMYPNRTALEAVLEALASR